MTGARVRVLVVDDEPAARDGLAALLARDGEVEVAGTAADGRRAVEAIRARRPDVVFLDVQMPGLDGFAVLEALRPGPLPVVVFVTAYDAHALRAFEFAAVDYLLKPYTDERCAEALARAKDEVRRRAAGELSRRLDQLLDHLRAGAGAGDSPAPASDRIAVRSGGEVVYLRPDEVDWVEADGDEVVFHVGAQGHRIRGTLAATEQRLGVRFARLDRSTLVNVERVRRLSPAFAGEHVVLLKDGQRLRVTAANLERLQAAMASGT